MVIAVETFFLKPEAQGTLQAQIQQIIAAISDFDRAERQVIHIKRRSGGYEPVIGGDDETL